MKESKDEILGIGTQIEKSRVLPSEGGKKHPIWYSPITGKESQTSHHKNEEVKKGTLNSILMDAGL